jgi:hypothetical protein
MLFENCKGVAVHGRRPLPYGYHKVHFLGSSEIIGRRKLHKKIETGRASGCPAC